MEWLELLTSAAGGGLFGLIGAGFKQFMSWKQEKERYAFQIAMAEQDRANLAAEMELAQVKGTIDLELQESTASSEGLLAAMAHDSTITQTSQWVADLRGSVRPVLTYGLVVLAFVMVMTDSGNPHAGEIIFMAMTAVGFWFGDSPRRK